MDFEQWQVDINAGEARHECGLIIRVEGDPANPSSVDPNNFPKSLSFVDQARLLRCGMEALASAAQSGGYRSSTGPSPTRVKSKTAQSLEEKARLFAENPDKPKRAVLSLKRRKPSEPASSD
ncbi:hypothetical protein KO507_02860 [Gilvimarinus agarilyticus]|uniref:hypothetical protein n=1 Tax=unclassified Gilvimarinus TaxID=2642066 RepID=UPI001C090F9A|nr:MULTISPECIES: hypothetical protein [unclassified Gilvimarinus]MBU2884700.1 hypothetical protein [Gilvimarinus agarilyticus]MDO6569808.1 hypothetical protein [Gilvimarinus sp. 2_MG-2023]MDO6747378.1 hypothetical protein [Gilvimarinus sp. 1_MG-2023]